MAKLIDLFVSFSTEVNRIRAAVYLAKLGKRKESLRLM